MLQFGMTGYDIDSRTNNHWGKEKRGEETLTPHQRPHRRYQVYQLGLYASIILRRGAEGGFGLCAAPADCVCVLEMNPRGLKSRTTGAGRMGW